MPVKGANAFCADKMYRSTDDFIASVNLLANRVIDGFEEAVLSLSSKAPSSEHQQLPLTAVAEVYQLVLTLLTLGDFQKKSTRSRVRSFLLLADSALGEESPLNEMPHGITSLRQFVQNRFDRLSKETDESEVCD